MTKDAKQFRLPKFICVVGQQGSGKDTYGKHLEGLGYLHISAGDFIRDEARRQGHKDPLSRELLTKIGDELRQEFGPGPIASASVQRYKKIESDFPAGMVISGFRRVGEVEMFKKHGAVVL